MSALSTTAPLVLRRRGALGDLLPIAGFTAASAVLATVLGGVAAFGSRLSDQANDPYDLLGTLFTCAVIASALLLPSAAGLGAAAARLSLARREQDLAAIRLIGGTRQQVVGLAVLDVLAQAGIGTVLGLALHVAWSPLLTHLDFGIPAFTMGELVLPWWGFVLLLLGVLALAAGSAGIALLGVAITPLGVARASRTVKMSILRPVIWVGILVTFVAASKLVDRILGSDEGAIIATMVVLMALVVGGVNIVGPFLLWGAARMIAAVTGRPALLVGARRLAADPKAGWRTVSGITFALVIAGFMTLLNVLSETSSPDEADFATAMSTGAYLTLAIAALLAAVSTGVTQAARVLDQADTYRSQHVGGAEITQLHRARLAEIAIPLALSGVVATLSALVLLAPMLMQVASIGAVVQYVLSATAAMALVVVSVLVSSPLVRRAARGREASAA